ncbi:MAG: hypothetical protein Q8R57_05220 [Bacteroidota bacterium]|nr:hypothetical protein [Bacteroidota bacterium]
MKVKRYMLFLLLNLLLNAIQSKNATHWADSIYNVLQEEKEKQVLISEPHTDTLLYIYQLHGEFCKSIDLLYISAEYYKIKSDYKKALSCAILANQIIEKDKCKSPNIKPKLYYLFAKIFLSLKDIKKAKKYIDLGIQSWQQSDLKKEILIRLYLLKGALSENSKEELYFYTLAYGLSIESKDVKMEEISLHSMGSFYAVVTGK